MSLTAEQREHIRRARSDAKRESILYVADHTASYYRDHGIVRTPMDILRLRVRTSAALAGSNGHGVSAEVVKALSVA